MIYNLMYNRINIKSGFKLVILILTQTKADFY